jgi:hypothetical protein
MLMHVHSAANILSIHWPMPNMIYSKLPTVGKHQYLLTPRCKCIEFYIEGGKGLLDIKSDKLQFENYKDFFCCTHDYLLNSDKQPHKIS